MSAPSNPGSTLVFCPIGLGNFIMLTPALAFLSRELGRENLSLLALKGSIRDMAKESGLFGTLHTWDPDKEGMTRGLATLKEIRRAGYRNLLLFFPTSHWKFGIFARLTGIPNKAGFDYVNVKWPRRVQTLSLALDLRAHDVDQNIRLVEAFLGKPHAGPRGLMVPLRSAAPQPALVPESGYYVCHPGSSAERGMAEKRLPPAAYGDLLRRIRRESGLKALLIGGPEEKELRDEILALAGDAAFTAPSRGLEETAGQIRGARFFLGNDSGLMHVSVALGLPCVAFFGPTDEGRTGPYGPGHLVLRRPGLACAPCWTASTVGDNPPCIYGDTRCLRDFPVDDIWPRVKAFLAALTSRAAGPSVPGSPAP
jgi:ADP-heptose:LPS heptosyltransferase